MITATPAASGGGRRRSGSAVVVQDVLQRSDQGGPRLEGSAVVPVASTCEARV